MSTTSSSKSKFPSKSGKGKTKQPQLQESRRLFANIPDVDRKILLSLDDEQLFPACILNKYTESLANSYFWYCKFFQTFGADLGPHDQIDYRRLYQELRTMFSHELAEFVAEQGSIELVNYALHHGADIDSVFVEAISHGALSLVKYVIEEILIEPPEPTEPPKPLELPDAPKSGKKIRIERRAAIHHGNYGVTMKPPEPSKSGNKAKITRRAAIDYDGDDAPVKFSEPPKSGNKAKITRRAAIDYDGDDAPVKLSGPPKSGNKAKITRRAAIDYDGDDAPVKLPEPPKSGVNAKITQRESIEYDGYDALMWISELSKSGTKITRRADIHCAGDNAVALAAEKGHLDVVEYLIKNGASVRHSALSNASAAGHLEVVQYLIENGADIHAQNDEALESAAYGGQLLIIEYLMANGVDIHANHDNAVKRAALGGHLGVVKYLIEEMGADFNAGSGEGLGLVAGKGDLKMVKYLVEHGAHVRSYEDYAVREAVQNKHPDVVKYLVDHGAENDTGDDGEPIILRPILNPGQFEHYRDRDGDEHAKCSMCANSASGGTGGRYTALAGREDRVTLDGLKGNQERGRGRERNREFREDVPICDDCYNYYIGDEDPANDIIIFPNGLKYTVDHASRVNS